MDTKTAIQTGDAAALRSLLAANPSLGNELIRWGEDCRITTRPLHFVSDMFFNGTLEAGLEVPLIDALLDAGADVDFQTTDGETALIGAASLGAEDVGLRLLDAGAKSETRGAGGETALHWAASMGCDRLVRRLIDSGAPLDINDDRHHSSPMGWALHGWRDAESDDVERYYGVVRQLVAAGASVEPEFLANEKVRADPRMLATLRGETPW